MVTGVPLTMELSIALVMVSVWLAPAVNGPVIVPLSAGPLTPYSMVLACEPAAAVNLIETALFCPVAVSPVGAPGTVPAIGEAVIVTDAVAVLAGDELSVTVSVAVYVPAFV